MGASNLLHLADRLEEDDDARIRGDAAHELRMLYEESMKLRGALDAVVSALQCFSDLDKGIVQSALARGQRALNETRGRV